MKKEFLLLQAISGNQFLVTSTQADSVVKTGVNPFHNRLFYSTLHDGSLQNLEPVTIDGIDGAQPGNGELKCQWQTTFILPNGKKKKAGISLPYIIRRKKKAHGVVLCYFSVNLEDS